MPPPQTPHGPAWKPAVFVLGGVFCVTPLATPAVALALGAIVALAGLASYPRFARTASRQLIQWSVATLGLLVPIPRLADIAREGLLFAVATIGGTFLLAALAGRFLRTGREQTTLIASGTAICGGSAIAAVGAAIGAGSAGMAIATGAIFLLNAAALYIFPIVGHALHLTESQFGTWAGVAIHDVSSVTGAAQGYVSEGGEPGRALEVATVVKLSRVLWIVPVAMVAGWLHRERGAGRRFAVPVPWLIVLFVLASVAATLVDSIATFAPQVRFVARLGFQGALYLIGCGLSIGAMREVGARALGLAVILWIAIAGASLAVVMATVA